MGSVAGVPPRNHPIETAADRARIAHKLRSCDAKIRSWTEERDRLIVGAVDELNMSLREVADLAGVSHQTVKNIVERKSP